MSNSKEFRITKAGVLKEYLGKEAHVVIPDGVTEIAPYVFNSSRTLVSIVIPDSVKVIGEETFGCCEDLEQISIPKDCVIADNALFRCHKLVDEKGLLILGNRLFTYFSEDKEATAVIPDNVETIDNQAFLYSCPRNIEMSLHCPLWKDMLIRPDGTTITFRDEAGNIAAKVILVWKEESYAKQQGAQFSIRQENHAFDFAGYDAYWSKFTKTPNKLRVALTRIQYPYALSEEMRSTYEAYIKKQSLAAGQLLIDQEQADLLSLLAEKQFISKTSLPKLVDYANQAGKTTLTAILLSAQNALK